VVFRTSSETIGEVSICGSRVMTVIVPSPFG
jgi:hypothetical protein